MKAEVPATGKVESGFRMPSDGWHVFKFEEGIGLLTNKDGDIVMNDRGARCWKFVLSVDDDKDEDNGTTIDVLVYEDSKKGADMVESWLAATGLLGKFAKNFPNNEVFDEPVMSKVKVSLPKELIKGKTEQRTTKSKKDGKEYTRANLVAWGPMKGNEEEMDAELFGGKGSGNGGGKASKPAAESKPAAAEEEW